MAKTALAMIAGSDAEAPLLYRCLTSIAPHVDAIYLTITKPNQKQLEAVAAKFNAVVSHYAWDDSFERARNFSFDQVPAEFDYLIWTDCDDVWEGAEKIPELVTKMEELKATSIHLDYNYQIAKDGTVEVVHPRERIVKRGYYTWKGHLHETLVPTREVENLYAKDAVVNHYPSPSLKEDGFKRNLRILEKAYREEGDTHDPRTEYYLARSLYDDNQFERAEQLLRDYLTHSGWDEERAMAHNYLGNIRIVEGKWNEAIDEFLSAVRERPEYPTWYVNLAFCYAMTERYEQATHYARVFTRTPRPQTAIVQVQVDDEVRYYLTIYMIAFAKRKLPEAKEAMSELVRRFPESEDFATKLKGVTRLEQLVDVTKAVETLITELGRTGETENVRLLLQALPVSISENAYVAGLRNKHLPPTTWPEKSIVYWAGKSMEEWTPDTLETGLGGSETAVVHLARLWAKAGYSVTVYGNPGVKEGIYDGVEYLGYHRFNRYDTFDTLIIWRAPWELDHKWKARSVLFDAHDVLNPNEFTPERLANVDRVMVKSEYHRSLIPDVPDDKVAIIPNGVDEDLFKWNKATRDPYKLIYASSYDRGLEAMLTHGWPIIKQAVPQATLDIYYGWQMFDAVHKHNPERQLWKKRMIELMSQPGIRELGRVGQKTLIKAKSKASIHWYGSTFEEIDCISVRESAYAGCIPVTTTIGALKGKPYSVQIYGDPYIAQTHELIAKRIATLLTEDATRHRTAFKAKAKEETWRKIADRWLPHL